MTAVLLTVPLVAAVPTPAHAVSARPGDIITIAGGGVGDQGAVAQGVLCCPDDVVSDAAGNLYIADRIGTVRKIDTHGIITTVAGNGIQGTSGDGGPATKAELNSPFALAFDKSGNLFISDSNGNDVRKVTPAGIISTFAGTGIYGSSGDGGPATKAQIFPYGIAFDQHDNLFIADNQDVVRKVDHASGIITTVAGTSGTFGFSGDGGPATSAQLGNAQDVAFDNAGNLLIADDANNRVRMVTPSGTITTFAGSGATGYGNGGFGGDGGPASSAVLDGAHYIDVDSDGNVYISYFGGAGTGNRIRKVTPSGTISTFAGNGGNPFIGPKGDGGPATSAPLSDPAGMTFDPSGNMFFAELNNFDVRKVDTNGTISTFAGQGVADGEAATNASLNRPTGVVPDGSGNIYVGDTNDNRVRKFTPGGIITTVAGTGTSGYSGDGGPGTSAKLAGPSGLALDSAGSLYIADTYNNAVRKLTPDGTITTVAGSSTAGFSGDKGAATAAQLNRPEGLFVVTSGATPRPGTLYIADTGNNRIRVVNPAGTINTVVGNGLAGYSGDNGPARKAKLHGPTDVTRGPTGDLYIADTGTNVVRRVDVFGNITTFAGNGATGFAGDGGPATSAPLNDPRGVMVDGTGGLVISETGHARVRRVDTSGIISTVAGNGIEGYAGDRGPAIQAALARPTRTAVDPTGNLYIADRGNNVIREVLVGTPAFPVSGCGQLIVHNTTLQQDIGPCPGNGLVIGASGITLNLNGHYVTGQSNKDSLGASAGILAIGQSNVTITGGTVRNFAAGISIIGGVHHSITNIHADHNVGGMLNNASAEYGDGIVVFFSPDNTISGNVLNGDGVFNAIGVYGENANANTVENNLVTNTAGNANGAFGTGIFFDEFLSFSQPRGINQTGNLVLDNTVTGSFNSGISFIGNANGIVKGNTVLHNGVGGTLGAFPGNGIGIQGNFQGNPVQNNLVENNAVHNNFGFGIDSRNSEGDQILNNDAANNARGNSFAGSFVHYYDLLEEHPFSDPQPPTCTDTWLGNTWGSGGVNPPCVAGTHGAALASRPPLTAGPAATAARTSAPAPTRGAPLLDQ